ncbi:baseplate J/gp47 family protein [Caviibacterium pharyngocola]|uniref:Baseplate J protein n=1 Tax=Caviibacterium pharyngocola TaxID=28159 RepID=A0A2M8RXZ9_9PAST|nr:baseplate J/gp47 family protein [Caviibacterium pharyngocola]PJG83761.1 baseplate J protein [Caviibacterium pharyngocola]
MFIVPSFSDIRRAILRDLQSLEPTADIAEDSDNFVRASSLAAVAENLYAHQKWLMKQFFPDTADTEFLEKHAALRGIRRKNATYAQGNGATFTGLVGATLSAGLQIKTADGRFYETLESAVINSAGSVRVAVRALAPGAAQNIIQSVAGVLMAAPKGVQSDVVLNNVVGGTDTESDSALLARLLERIRRPPAGGNRYDYRNWALSVEGVDAAYVYPLRRGLGTVDIAITADNDVPSDETVRKVQAYIDDVRPVTAKESKVVKPDVTRVAFNVKVKLDGVSLSTMTQTIQTALTEHFNRLNPGDDFIVSQCEAVISDLIGVVDRQFIAPRANIKANVTDKIEWFRLGTVAISELA